MRCKGILKRGESEVEAIVGIAPFMAECVSIDEAVLANFKPGDLVSFEGSMVHDDAIVVSIPKINIGSGFIAGELVAVALCPDGWKVPFIMEKKTIQPGHSS